MDRNIVYPGAIPLDTDVLTVQRSTMVALGYLAQATLGTGTVVDGLACTQTTVASLSFNIGPGSILALSTVDATAFGSLSSDNTDPLVKMGVNIASTQFTTTAPVTGGQSINYLVQAAFQESDATSVVLPYYNSSNPAVPYSGPANAGTAQNTQRLQRVNLQMKTGTSAATGSQVTPTPDGGFVGLWVVTVAFGQTTVIAGNISVYATAPFLNASQGVGLKPGRLLNVRVLPSSGIYTPTTGTNMIEVEAVGGGGAGGGGFVTSGSTYSVGSGGASGAISRGRYTSGFSSVSVTIGQGGTPASGAAGGNGTTTSFGALLTSPGGGGGPTATVASGSTVVSGQATPAVAGSGSGIIFTNGGQPGPVGLILPATPISGQGAPSPLGGGGGVNTSGGVGGPGLCPGAGGAGSANLASQANSLGGAGAAGVIIVKEYS